MGQVEADEITLIEDVDQANTYKPKDPDALGYVTQTTLSVDDTAEVIVALRKRFPNLNAPAAESICYATTNRQEVVKVAAEGSDHFLIVGAPNSSNSKRLVEVATRAGAKKSILVQKASEIPWDEIEGVKAVGLSAGASAPEILVNEIIEAFRERFNLTLEFVETVKEDEEFLVARDLRDTELTTEDMFFVNGAL